MKITKAPKGLLTQGRKFWRSVLGEFELTESHDLERLRQACKTLDEMSQSEEILAAEGRFVTDRFSQVHEHPAGRALRDHRIIFCRLLREMGLDLATPEDTRPRRQY